MPFSGASTTTHHHQNTDFHGFTLGRKQVEEHAKTELDGKEQPETFRDEAEETKADENSNLDPISALRSIFKPKEAGKRAPVDAHHVMNKYKQRNFTATQNFRTARSQKFRSGRNEENLFSQSGPMK